MIEVSKKAHDNAFCAMAMSNLAVVQIREDNPKDALKNARSATELLQKIYSKKCSEVTQYLDLSTNEYITKLF